MLDNESDNLLELVSFEKLDFFDNESDDDGSDYRSAGTCNFPFRSDQSVGRVGESVGCVSGMGSGIFFQIGIESIGEVVLLVVFVPKGVESKGGQLIEIFCC